MRIASGRTMSNRCRSTSAATASRSGARRLTKALPRCRSTSRTRTATGSSSAAGTGIRGSLRYRRGTTGPVPTSPTSGIRSLGAAGPVPSPRRSISAHGGASMPKYNSYGIQGLCHFSIPVKDVQGSLTFYEEIFGAKVYEDEIGRYMFGFSEADKKLGRSEHIFVEIAGQRVELAGEDPGGEAPLGTHHAFAIGPN